MPQMTVNKGPGLRGPASTTNVQDLYSQEPDAAQATAAQAGSYGAQAAQAEDAPTLQSQDAAASYAGTRDAAAMSGSASQARGTLATARDAAAGTAEATGYNAMTGEIDPEQTASARLNEITSQDSANMRRAARQGMLAAGRRGLQNSSFAAGAAQGAMVDRATPLAQQESQQAFQQSLQNQADVNRAREISTGRETDVSQLNAQLQTNVSLANASESNRVAMLNAQIGSDISQFNADQLNEMAQFNASLGTEVALRNAAAYNEAAQLNAQLETAVSQGNAEQANRLRQRQAELQTEIALNNAQMQTQVSLENAAAANRAALNNAQLETEVSLSNARAQNEFRRDVLAQNAALNEQFMRGEQAIDLASVQGRYQMLISSNETAARLYDSYFNSIAQAMANDQIAPDRVAQYVNVQQSMLEAGLRMMDSMNNLDLGEFELPGARSTGANQGSRISPTPGTAPGGVQVGGPGGLPPGQQPGLIGGRPAENLPPGISRTRWEQIQNIGGPMGNLLRRAYAQGVPT